MSQLVYVWSIPRVYRVYYYPGGVYGVLLPGWYIPPSHTRVVYPAFTYPGGMYSLLLPGWYVQPPATRVVYPALIPRVVYPALITRVVYVPPFLLPGWCMCLPSCYPGGIPVCTYPGGIPVCTYPGGECAPL